MIVTFTFTLSWNSLLWLLPLSFYILWMGYILTMELKEEFKTLRWEVQVAGLLPAILSYLLDVILQLVLSLLFLELPKEVTITKRMKRWKSMPTIAPKKAKFASYVCNSWLNPFNKGHC